MPHQAVLIEDVLDHLYLAAGDPSGWTDCIISLARVFEADAAVFLAQRSDDVGYAVGASTGISADLVRRYDSTSTRLIPGFSRCGRGKSSAWLPGAASCARCQS